MRTLIFALMALAPAFVNAEVTQDTDIIVFEDNSQVVCRDNGTELLGPQLILYYDYGDTPIGLEVNFFSEQTIDTKSVRLGKHEVQYGLNISADSLSKLKYYSYAIELHPSTFGPVPSEVVVTGQQGEHHITISAEFRQCVEEALKPKLQ